MKAVILTLILSALALPYAQAEKHNIDDPESVAYIQVVAAAGKNQYNYKQYLAMADSLVKQGYDKGTGNENKPFVYELVQSIATQEKRIDKVLQTLTFEISENFSSKVFTVDGKRILRMPHLTAHGTLEQLCDKKGENCGPFTNIQFVSYELGWLEFPEKLGGGTSSAD